MRFRSKALGWLVCALGLLSAACATRAPQVTSAPAPPAATEAVPAPLRGSQLDAVEELIALSEQHFDAGERELADGDLDAARAAFDAAVDVVLHSPGGARSDSRLSEHFDELVSRIRRHELGDLGFAEKALEPATLDEILSIATSENPVATPETERAVARDLETVVHDIGIPQNSRVLAFVQLFAGRLKGYLEDGLSRGAPYLPMIQEVFRAEGLPLDLAYVPLIESAFKPNALSRAKAMGMWQFMRGTALENGLKHDWYVDERADPEKATRAAAKYLKTLYTMFNDWHLALASYNGGPGRVQRAIKRSGRDDFWKLSATSRYLPRETRDYVPLILAAIVIARNPAQYDMQVTPAEAPRYETVTVAGAIDLRHVADWGRTTIEEIHNLNPELRRWTTPVRGDSYELKVPLGSSALIHAHLTAMGLDGLTPVDHYIVKKGETLLGIARKLRVTRVDLAEANYLSMRAGVTAGQRLIIPRAPALHTSAEASPAARPASDAVRASGVLHVDDADPPRTVRTHRVKRGETLSSIARDYGTTVALLKQWNGLSTNVIRVDQHLVIERLPTLATN